MSQTVRQAVEHLYRYLRKEQRAIPNTDPDLDDPLPEALAAINGALQEMATLSPKFAASRDKHAVFHAPASLAVSGLSEGGTTVIGNWPVGVAGNIITLPGESAPNRIESVNGNEATLAIPYFGGESAGTAHLLFDSATLSPDVITVYNPVSRRDGGPDLRPANSPSDLTRKGWQPDDFGRSRLVSEPCSGMAYYINAAIVDGRSVRQMRLSAPVTDRLILTFQARCSLGVFDENSVFKDTSIPVIADFTESIFLPLALWRFFASSVMRNTDVPDFVKDQVQVARSMLESMKPQANKRATILPGL